MNNLDIYYANRNKMKVGDGLSFEGTGIISDAIGLWSRRSHWANIGQWVEFEGQEPRLPIYEAAYGEYNIRALSKRLREYKGKIWWHPLKEGFSGYRDAMHRKMWDLLGTGYDYKSLIENMWGRQDIGEDKVFCSEAGSILIREIPEDILLKLATPAKHEPLRLLLAGVALRPGGMASLPVWGREVRLV